MGNNRGRLTTGLGLEKVLGSLFVDLEFALAGLGLYPSEYMLGHANPHVRAEVLGESPMSVLAEAATWCLDTSGGMGNVGPHWESLLLRWWGGRRPFGV